MAEQDDKIKKAAKYAMSVISFSRNIQVPEFTKQNNKEWIKFGKDNGYPDYLITLFERSSTHRAIITGKVDLVLGKGWIPKDENDSKALDFIKAPNKKESLRDLTEKVALDLEIFGGYYLEVIRKRAGEGYIINHLPFHRMRTNEDKSQFYYTKKWGYNPENNKDWTPLPAFDPNNSEQQKGVFYYHEYSPKTSEYPVYPSPEYIGAINLIEADYEIANFHLSNIKNGFWGAFAILFKNGVPSAEEQKKIEAKLAKKFSGTDNAGKFLTLYAPGKDNAPELESLTPNEMDKMFTVLDKMVEQKIFTGHKVTSPMLFGVKTEGQLGGRTEMIVAYELFKNSYIVNKQNVIEDTFNYLFTGNRFERVIKLEEKPRIQESLDMSEIAKHMTPDEIRKEAGLPELEKNTVEETDDVLQKLNTMSPLLATQVLQSMSREQILALVGAKPEGIPSSLDPAVTPHTPTDGATPVTLKKQFTEEDDNILLSHFKECGRPASEYIIHKSRYLWFSSPNSWREQLLLGETHLLKQCFAKPVTGKVIDLELDILRILDKSPDATYKAIAKQLKISEDRVKSVITDLVDAGLLDKSGKVITITPAGEKVIPPISNEIIEIELMYQYALNPAYPGPAIIPTSRKFCRDMIADDKLYTSEEIQKIASKVDYDVWLYKGGWYHNPKTGDTTPSCRHIWLQTVVSKKK